MRLNVTGTEIVCAYFDVAVTYVFEQDFLLCESSSVKGRIIIYVCQSFDIIIDISTARIIIIIIDTM